MAKKSIPLQTDQTTPPSVPAFTCVVYVSRRDGEFAARVANLEGLQATADSERAVLTKIVASCKQAVSQLLSDGGSVPWIDPPVPPEPDEQTRYLPMHL